MDEPPLPGTLITVAPAPTTLGKLLRIAIDSERVGASRIHLPDDQPDLREAVAAIHEQTDLIATGNAPVEGFDRINSEYTDLLLDDDPDLSALLIEVATIVAEQPAGVGLGAVGHAALPVLLVALACGGHLWVGPPEEPHADPRQPLAGSATRRGTHRLGDDPDSKDKPGATRSTGPKDHPALVARASGLARIAGRPPLDSMAARRLLGIPTSTYRKGKHV